MKREFELKDINELKIMVLNSSLSNDYTKTFLKRFSFEDVYKPSNTDKTFVVGGKNNITIEFFNFENPYLRKCHITYYEEDTPAGMPEVIEF